MSRVLVEEHVERLREAAQAPSQPLARRIWAIFGRGQHPQPPVAWVVRSSETRELERRAA